MPYKRKDKQFKCDKCSRDFGSKRQLKSHVKDVHDRKIEIGEGQGHD